MGHHIGHDIQFLNAACERHFDLTLRNRYLDTMDLTLRLKDSDGDRAYVYVDALRELFALGAAELGAEPGADVTSLEARRKKSGSA